MTSKTRAEMSHREKLQLMDTELKSFYEYCRQVGFTDEEMEVICRPFTNAVRRASFQKWLRVLIGLSIVLCAIYLVTNSNTVAWHSTAIGRIFLIKILPIWNWKPLFYRDCLINKNSKISEIHNVLSLSDCAVCEAISEYDFAYLILYLPPFYIKKSFIYIVNFLASEHAL